MLNKKKSDFISVIIPAAGSGKRMQSSIDKQFLKINSKTILELCLGKIQSFKLIDEIILVLRKEQLEKNRILLKQYPKIIHLVEGGKKRQESVVNGLKYVSEKATYIFVHDAVRPFIKEHYFKDLIEALKYCDCALIATAVSDTIKIVDTENDVIKTPKRSMFWAAQTPQAMRALTFHSCYQKASLKDIKGTDEAMIAEQLGLKVKIVDGDDTNIKITRTKDLILAKELIKVF